MKAAMKAVMASLQMEEPLCLTALTLLIRRFFFMIEDRLTAPATIYGRLPT